MSGDTLKSDLKKVLEEATQSIKDIDNHSDLEKLRVKFLGKKSLLNTFMKSLSDLDNEEKAQAGKKLNDTKKKINDLLGEKKISLSKSKDKEDDGFDFSMPGKASSVGSLHPMTKTMNCAIHIFESFKFECVEGPDIED